MSNIVFSNTVSTRLTTQLPQYIVQQYPTLVIFLQAYYQFLEQDGSEGAIYQLYNLLNNRLVDTADDQFLEFMKNDFLPYFPATTALDIRKLLKQATHFYQTKGSQNSIQFLFRALYNLNSEIYYPKQNIMKLSAGKWQNPQALKLLVSPDISDFDITQLVARLGQGSVSNATCTIESATLTIDPTLKIEFIELFISNLTKPFAAGEDLVINCGVNPQGAPIIFREPIVGQLSEIDIDPNAPGLLYVGVKYFSNGAIAYPGNPVSIIGGLAVDANAIEAVAYVNTVSEGSVTGVSPEFGGYGYTVYPNTLLTFVNAPTDNTGSGANAIVDGIQNTTTISLNTDSIKYKLNVNIGSNNYDFTNFPNANLSTTFAQAFTTANVTIGTVSHVTVESGGFGYTQVPSVALTAYYDTDFSSDEEAVYTANQNITTFDNWIASRPIIAALGAVAAITVTSGGRGYSNITDLIYPTNATGWSLATDFVTDGNGSIIQVLVTNGGAGYMIQDLTLIVANSNSMSLPAAGNGAVLQPFGYGSGAVMDVSVSQIGQIVDFRFDTRGLDYVSTPLISLRNEDVKIKPIDTDEFFVQTEVIYQGANVNAASFIAYVDGYDRANSTLRLYNYTGTINLTQNLIGANFDSVPLSANVYGNGKARANAQFLGGLIDFPGYWLDTTGFLSADQYFEDSTIYHNYSYLVKVEQLLSKYEDTLMKIVHPAGMKMMGLCTITSENMVQPIDDPLGVSLANSANVAGTVTLASGFNKDFGLLSTGSGVVVYQAQTAPDMSLSAILAQETVNANSMNHTVYKTPITTVGGREYILSAYVKPYQNTQWFYMQFDNGTGDGYGALYNLHNGTIVGSITNGTYNVITGNGHTISKVGTSGWYKCSVYAALSNTDTTVRTTFGLASNNMINWYPSYPGSGANGIYLYGVNFKEGHDANGYLTGFGTTFEQFSNGDMIVLQPTGRAITKQITGIVNSTFMYLESDAAYFANDGLNITQSSHMIQVNTGSTLLGANDYLVINVSGNLVSANIVNTDIGSGNVNVNVTFSSTVANCQYMVWPHLDNVSFEIYTI